MSDTEIIFGLKPVQEALGNARSINRIYVAKESRASGCKRILDEAKSLGIQFDFVPQAKLNEMTRTQEHQGIAARVSPVEYVELTTFLENCPETTTVLVLDQIHHPKNLGMIIRTAVGAGVGAVILTVRKGALVDDSVVRASTGTVFQIPIIVTSKLGDDLKRLKDAGFWVYGMDAAARVNVSEVDWPKRTALLVGNETKGIRPIVAKQCDELVSIPLENKLDSLNVAVATGIALFGITASR
ncbi:MAG: 23S rRNA (guanosine(2251)-2'-O)-methyltransferase RlmB [Candidatus Hydrogenedentota bacterium]